MNVPFIPHPKPIKAPKKARKRMPRTSAKRKAHYASDEGQADVAYMGKVRQRPCIICVSFGMVQTSPTEVHHPICGRYGNRKAPDRNAIPVCQCHHQGMRFDRDKTKIAIHQNKSAWIEAYGPDTDYIAVTQDAILGATL